MATRNGKRRSILVVNPNTTKSMTAALQPLLDSLGCETTDFVCFTAPSGVASVNNQEDAAVSAEHCMPCLEKRLNDYDAFLVCCYSPHPLVRLLRAEIDHLYSGPDQKVVTGIFESSVATCLQSIDVRSKFGIVSTGKQWEEIFDEAIHDLFGLESSTRYAGTETTGLNADQLHSTPIEDVNCRIKGATKHLLARGAEAICLGCAGMAGMGRVVREACIEQLGDRAGGRILIVDGVVSGALFLDGALRSR